MGQEVGVLNPKEDDRDVDRGRIIKYTLQALDHDAKSERERESHTGSVSQRQRRNAWTAKENPLSSSCFVLMHPHTDKMSI